MLVGNSKLKIASIIFLFFLILLSILLVVKKIDLIRSLDIVVLRGYEVFSSRVGDLFIGIKSDSEYMRVERGRSEYNDEYIIKNDRVKNGRISQDDFRKFPTSLGDQWNTNSYLSDLSMKLNSPEIVWQHTVNEFESQFNPIFYNGFIYFSNGKGTISKLNYLDGALEWSRVFDSYRVAKRGAVIDPDIDVLYFGDGRKLRAVNLSDGSDYVSFSDGALDIGDEVIIAPRLLTDQKIIVVTINGKILVADSRTGIVERQFILSSDGVDEKKRSWGFVSVYNRPRIWSGFALDSSRNIIYLATSNPAPVLIGIDRPGANSLSSSVVAVSLSDGNIVWSFQDVSHDLWDLDIASPPVLTSVEVDGKLIDVVVAIGKSGNVWLLDRDTGKSIFDYAMRKTPTSLVPGEKTSAYQKHSITPPNLLGKYNTATFSNDKLKWGFYDPPRIDEDIVIKGLHGGAMWPGFSVSGQWIATVVNHDWSMLSLSLSSSKQQPVFSECEACHNDRYQPRLANLVGLKSGDEIRSLLENGFQAMPPQKLGEDRVVEIIEFLTSPSNSFGSSRSGVEEKINEGDVVRAPYKKLYTGPNQSPEFIVINKASGRIAYREKINSSDINLAMGAASFLGSQYVAITGTSDKKVRIYRAEDFSKIFELKLPNHGSGSPVFFTQNGRVYMLVQATGSSTVKAYYDSEKIGGSLVLYNIGTVSASGD